MLDERWSEDVEEAGTALRKLLVAECTPVRVRAAEAGADGRDPALEAQLEAFGLNGLDAEPAMFARIAMELGRALAPTGHVETMPVLALLGRSGVALGFDGLAPVSAAAVAVRGEDGVYILPLDGKARRSAAGDWLIRLPAEQGGGERVGDLDLAGRLQRYANLVEAARMVGAGQALLAHGVAYAGEREQFGKIIATYQGVAHRLSRASAELDAAELMVRKTAFVAAREGGTPSEAFAIMVRAKAIEAARTVSTHVHQVFGGNGFALEYDVQLFSRRLRSWAMRGPRAGAMLADLGRMLLDPERRDGLQMLWHHESGMPLPRWAREADAMAGGG